MIALMFSAIAIATGPVDWNDAEWLSVKEAALVDTKPQWSDRRAAPGTSWFSTKVVNEREVESVRWITTALGTYELYVNGERIGADALKPGFTSRYQTRLSFAYDITDEFVRGKGAENVLTAEVGAGWWRDHIFAFKGKKSAFRGILEVKFKDGSIKRFGTNVRDWKCGIAGPVQLSGIFEGEEYDARIKAPVLGEGLNSEPEVNTEFKSKILPTPGAEVVYREDIARKPIEAYCWREAKGAAADRFGKIVKSRSFAADDTMELKIGESLVVDFGQNAAMIPDFKFEAKEGTVLTILPGEALNESDGEKSRGNDGPAGSLYRTNLRMSNKFMQMRYVFAGKGIEAYRPRFTFFGYRFLSMTATAPVRIHRLRSVPVTSITKAMEIGRIETGDKDVNRLIANVYWGQLSNYLSAPTDCPQRNERLGWTADTQVFAEAGAFNADTRRFFRKWMLDMRDVQDPCGSFQSIAPMGATSMRLGWSDAGVIVPYKIWCQFGDRSIVDENWSAMEKHMAILDRTRFETAAIREYSKNYQWADWLSCEKYESFSHRGFEKDKPGRVPLAGTIQYWDYLGGCYWLYDAEMMVKMAKGTGRDAAKYERMVEKARAYLKGRFFSAPDGLIASDFRDMQTPNLFALKLRLVEDKAKEGTVALLRQSFAAHGNCLQTGFLGTSILMDTLTENGMVDVAYSLLLQHAYPSWLYSVDQGATTIWERWNSYTKKDGFGSSGMNSFNHYAYGSVLAWIYKTAAGIAADPSAPGFKRIVMSPVPDRRLGRVKAEYRSAAGLIKSTWRYEGEKWIWNFTVPGGATAVVTLPGEKTSKTYSPGNHRIEKSLP